MKYIVDDKEIEVIIIKKNNKNTYIRVKEGCIYVTTNRIVPKFYIKRLLDENISSIKRMLDNEEEKRKYQDNFFYLGKIYDIVISTDSKISLDKDKIFVESVEYLQKWLKKNTEIIFKERLDYVYNLFQEKIPYPNLKIRKMKTRWGVCNRKNNNVTLNSELIKFGYEQIDYVIVHELSHFIHFNHSSNFWALVSKYCPDYKIIRKSLK